MSFSIADIISALGGLAGAAGGFDTSGLTGGSSGDVPASAGDTSGLGAAPANTTAKRTRTARRALSMCNPPDDRAHGPRLGPPGSTAWRSPL